MPARKKTLAEFVRDGTFLARRHRHLLASSPLLTDPALRALQQQFLAEPDSLLQLRIARELERAVRQRPRVGADQQNALRTLLGSLGPEGSAEQLLSFFPRFLSHRAGPQAGKPFLLDPFQAEFIREFWARDEHGERLYTVGLLGIPKGNGKTPLAAALGLYALLSETDAPEVYGVAGSREQARIAQRFANSFLEDSELAEWLTPGATIRCPLNHGFYSLLSSDGRLGQGVMPSAALVDEWWLFEHEREREAFNALARALHKRPGQAWLLATTTAGYNQSSQLAETYRRALDHPQLEEREDGFLLVLKDPDSGFLMHWYGAPEDADIEDPETIRRANPASWLRPQDLLRELQRPDTEELDWRRLHLNQWTKTRNAWLPAGLWQSLASQEELPERAEIFVGVDVGWTHDSTAVAWAGRLPDGRICLRVKVWTTDQRALGEYVAGGRMQLSLVEDFIRQLRSHYRIREVAFDPSYFGRSAQELDREGLTMVEFMPAGAPTRAAWQGFYQAAKEGTVTHDGDPVLAAHVEAAAAERTEHGLKVRKLKSSSRIDALAACVLAHSRCQLAKPRRVPNVFWMEA